MDNSIYEVTRDEYAGFIGGLKKDACDVEQIYDEHMTIMKIKSKARGVHFCTRIIPDDDVEHYYIFNMPLAEESVPNKPVLKITLDNKEEVQAFFNVLNKLQSEVKENARDI